MRADELKALAERVMRLDGPDRAVLRSVWYMLNDMGQPPSGDPVHCPDYLASIDAAMTLTADDDASNVLNDAMEMLSVDGWPIGKYVEKLARYVTAAALLAKAAQIEGEGK